MKHCLSYKPVLSFQISVPPTSAWSSLSSSIKHALHSSIMSISHPPKQHQDDLKSHAIIPQDKKNLLLSQQVEVLPQVVQGMHAVRVVCVWAGAGLARAAARTWQQAHCDHTIHIQ